MNDSPTLFQFPHRKITIDCTGVSTQGGPVSTVHYGIAPSPFGHCFLAESDSGIHRLEFHDTPDIAGGRARMLADRPDAQSVRSDDRVRQTIQRIFAEEREEVLLQVTGTEFQLGVWRALLALPLGTPTTYGEVASAVGTPQAARAVGSALGKNPVAYLVPCHLVLRKHGGPGGYRWGLERKRAMIEYELSKTGI